eukprot:COSAG06_NODE_2236_length_7275_cov_86.121656_9_plen_89_part_00
MRQRALCVHAIGMPVCAPSSPPLSVLPSPITSGTEANAASAANAAYFPAWATVDSGLSSAARWYAADALQEASGYAGASSGVHPPCRL